MASFIRIVACLAAGSAILSGAFAEEPKAKIEFRWLEDKAVTGLTEAKGIRTTCAYDLSYPHAKPVLTNKDIAEARLRKHDHPVNGNVPMEYFMVYLHLTAKAKKTLVNACRDREVRAPAVFVDGRYWGTACFRKAMVADFVPTAGYVSSRAEADRIVEACR